MRIKRIGMVVAVEIDAVIEQYGEVFKTFQDKGHCVYEYKLEKCHLFVIHSGIGQIAATMATQYLITKFQVEFIVNFGVVGGLSKEMGLTRTCIVDKVVHYEFDVSPIFDCERGQYLEYPTIYIPTSEKMVNLAMEVYPSLKKVICASGDKFIDNPKQKEEFHQVYHADICEMEAAGIVLTCHKNEIPCLLIKTVSDGVDAGAEEFQTMLDASAKACLDITTKIMNRLTSM